MNIHLTLSAPLPWLTAFAKLLARKKQISKHRVGAFILPRTLSFTKEGKRYIAILFVIGIAAINTGNNLLYLVVAMMLSIIVISGILSESTLRGIEISRILPTHIFAKRPAAIRWGIANKKRYFPSFSLSIDELSHGGFSAESGYIIKLPAGDSVTQTCFYTFPQRGLYKLEGFKITTRFPFGFFRKGRRLSMPADMLVYPNIKPIRQGAAHSLSKSGDWAEKVKGLGANLHSIRDYTFMDDSRIIHWKSTAKTARLMAKEFEQEGKKRVEIVFHNTLAEHPGFKDEFEDRVEEAAGIADYFIRLGFEVGFRSLNLEIPCKPGKGQLYRILRGLALIEPVAGDKPLPLTIKVISR